MRQAFINRYLNKNIMVHLLMLSAVLALMLPFPSEGVTAQPLLQEEDPITAAVEEAAGAVGGDFTVSTSSNSAGARWDIPFPLMPDTIIYRHDMIIYLTEYSETFEKGDTTFYGMPAFMYDNGMNGSWVSWSPGKIAGTDYYLEFSAEMATFRPTEGIDYIPAAVMAEALHQAALNHGLYDLVTSGVEETAPPLVVTEAPTQPPETGEVIITEEPFVLTEVPAQDLGNDGADPGVVVVPFGSEGEEPPADGGEDMVSAGTFEDAWNSREARGLRSAVLPLLGGLIGVGISLFAGQGAARTAGYAAARPVAAAPVSVTPTSPSVPPLPETPPALSAEELHTREMRKQGMVWSDGAGWQTPAQARQSTAWQANNRAAVDAEDAAWRRDQKKDRLDLEQNREEMEKAGKELDAGLQLVELNLKMMQIQRELLTKHHYVFNPNQGIPVWDSLTQARNYVMDTVFRTKGLTCEGYAYETFPKIKESVKQIYGEKAVVEVVKFDEKSSLDPRRGWFSPGAWKDWCDGFVSDNHVLTRITLPDKTELGADFHQYNAKNRKDILRPFEESRKAWKPYLGEHEFMETVLDR